MAKAQAMLVLHPVDPETPIPGSEPLAGGLARLGLITEPFDFAGTRHYAAGPEFTNLINFLGCLPHLVLDPAVGMAGGGHAFCHVHIPTPTAVPRLRRGGNTVAPRCPHCGHRPAQGRDWRPVAPDGLDLLCPACHRASGAAALRWRRTAAWGRGWVEIWGVFPSEAVPADRLLSGLAEITQGRPWDYAYLQP
jgi:hypothetical protein